MRILGIDYGEARVGIAISDELRITAQGLETINHNGNDKKLLARLDEIIPGVTISNGKYDCTELIKELKSIKEKINYRDFASNEVNYSFFKK